MKKKLLAGLATGLLLYGMAGIANATLITIGTANYNGSDYKLIWDDNNNGNSVVWLDYTKFPDNWTAQNNWAAGLDSVLTYNIFPVYSVAWDDDDWRLGSTVDGVFDWGYDGTTTGGYNIATSEMGHLYYEELDNLGRYDTAGNYEPPGWGLQNTGDFNNLVYAWYWSGTEYGSDSSYAWGFIINDGSQFYYPKSYGGYGLAVRSGQVVPEPATILLFGTGLASVIGARLRKKKK